MYTHCFVVKIEPDRKLLEDPVFFYLPEPSLLAQPLRQSGPIQMNEGLCFHTVMWSI